MIRFGRLFLVFGFTLLCLTVQDMVVLAGESDSFRIDESFIGPGSNLESSSDNFATEAGQSAIGNTGAVESASDNFQTQGGSETTADPSLTCELDADSFDFGGFSTAATATANVTFRVLNYTSYGYTVSILGDPPTMGSHGISELNPAAASQEGVEQFGINLVANTQPVVYGAFPVQVPSSDFSSGDASSNYNTPNQYRYVEGESIAAAGESSGRTDYTISYIINVSNDTPGGTYTTNQTILCTGTY